MSAKIPEIIDRLSGKIELLCDKYVMVRDERDAARAEACELREQVQTLRTALEQANTEIEYLRISHKIAPTRDDVSPGCVKTDSVCLHTALRIDEGY